MKRSLAVLIVGLGCFAPLVRNAAAHEQVALLYTRGNPPIEFAAAEITAVLRAEGVPMTTGSLDDLARLTPSTYLVLAGSSEESSRATSVLGVSALKPGAAQSYSIRRKADGPRTAHVVLAGEPIGAMYGGLDLAESIRLGTLADLKDSDHCPTAPSPIRPANWSCRSSGIAS